MAGELQNNSVYLNSLQAITDISYIFPSTQKTLTFSVENNGTGEWTADIRWQTLIVDQISYNRAEIPNFDSSEVIGYFEINGSAVETSTGKISIPSDMYTGKMLPASDRYVPVTVVNIRWIKNDGSGLEYSQNIAYIQQWEPGVPIGDPRDDYNYEPITPLASVLTLTANSRVIQSDILTFTAVTDIPIDIGPDNPCYFYKVEGGIAEELGFVYFNNTTKTAVFSIDTTPFEYDKTYDFYAEFGGRREYGRTRSNTKSVEILQGIPLFVDFQTFNPSKAVYIPGDNLLYTLGVIPDPGFPASGIPITNPVSLVSFDSFPPLTSSTFYSGNFSNGVVAGTLGIVSSMIDTDLAHTGTNWTITSSVQSPLAYTATLFVTNTETIKTTWGFQTLGQYARGTTNTSITVGNSTVKTVIAQPFPITITQDLGNTLQEEAFNITVATTSRAYVNNINIIAVNQATGSTSTLYSANNSGTSSFVTPITTLNTGTYTIYATYAGDIGNNIYWANQASTSNSLTHIIRTGNELGAKFVFYTNDTYDVLRAWASTTTTLTQTVDFKNGINSLGTSSWTRETVQFTNPREVILKAATSGTSVSFSNNFTSGNYWKIGNGWSSPNNDNNDDLTLFTNQNSNGYAPPSPTLYNKSADMPSPILNNRFRLFKYYDGTNYNLVDVPSFKGSNIADPIQFDQEWNINTRGYVQFDLNQPFINDNTAFYNYIESKFGYAAMNAYLATLSTLDGSALKINDLSFNDRPVASLPPVPEPDYPRYNTYGLSDIPSSAAYFFDRGTLDFAPTPNDLSVMNYPASWLYRKGDIAGGTSGYVAGSTLYRNPRFNQAVYDISYLEISNSTFGYAGSTIRYFIQGKNIPNGTIFYFEQAGDFVESDIIFGSNGKMSGQIIMNDNFGLADFTVVPSTTKLFKIRLKTSNGTVIGLATNKAISLSGKNDWNTNGIGYQVIKPTDADNSIIVVPSTIARGARLSFSIRYSTPGVKTVYGFESSINIETSVRCYASQASAALIPATPPYYLANFFFDIDSDLSNTDRNIGGEAIANYNSRLSICRYESIAPCAYVTITPLPPPVATPGSPQQVRQSRYDIYRMDSIGDSRGYNVVAINADSGFVKPIVDINNTQRIYFTGANNVERYIDLVEYIGETQWEKPIENAAQKAGTQARSLIKLWLYKFTPTIPQANTEFRTQYEQTSIIDLMPIHNWRPRPLPTWPEDYVFDTERGKYKVNYYKDVNFIGAEYNETIRTIDANLVNAYNDYQSYGKKTWISSNTNDPVENEKAKFYNDWYATFTNPAAKIYTKNVYGIVYDTITTDDLQSATVLLPKNTLTTSSGLHATWPGTRYLAAQYGKFNPFDIEVSSAFTGVDLDAWRVIPNSSALVTATIVTSTNPVNLISTVISEPLNILSNTGTITLFNVDTLQVINTSTISNNTASVQIFAENITSSTAGPFIRLQSKYQANNITPPVFSDIITLQAIKSSYNNGISIANTSSITTEIFNWVATPPYNNPGYNPSTGLAYGKTRMSGQIDFTLPSLYSTDSSGYATYRIFVTTRVGMAQEPYGPSLYFYTQYLGTPSASKIYYRDVPILINNPLPVNYSINLTNEPMWLTPEWWKGRRPGDPVYWPVSTYPASYTFYVKEIYLSFTIQALGSSRLAVGSKVFYQRNIILT